MTRSPVFIPFSNWINMPVIMSLTRVCAPNEMASPNAPAPASTRRNVYPNFREQDHHRDGADHHRQRVAKQRQQRPGPRAGQRTAMNIRCQPVFNQAGQNRPANGGEEEDQGDADQHIHRFCPASLCSHSRKSNRPQALNSSIMATQTVRMRAAFSEAEIQPFRRFCSSG